MQRLIPHFICQKYAAGDDHGHFYATTLFADISGFTAVTEQMIAHGQEAAERLAHMMGAILGPLVSSVYAHNGFITGLAGDAFTALFPLESDATGDAARRALAAARHMQALIGERARQTTVHGDFYFALKLGIGAGPVAWQILRDESASTIPTADNTAVYYFNGPGITACTNAEVLAHPGHLILSPTIYPHLADHVTTVPQNDHYRVNEILSPLPSPSTYNLPTPAPEILRAFIPSAIRGKVHQGEFRPVLTLFLNLKDAASLPQVVTQTRRLQRHYGGYLNAIQFGDKGCTLLLFWGMPTGFENDAERALRFVQALRRRITTPFRAGVTYRTMYAGFVGAPQRQDYSGYGRGVNLAARLMTNAPWNDIWVDERVHRRVNGRFTLNSVGKITFKGFKTPLPVYRLRPDAPRPRRPFYQGVLAGRERELAILDRFLRPLAKGRFGGVLLITGEAGIGKSRLVHTYQADHQTELNWLVCHADQTLRQSLHPFRVLLRRRFQPRHTNDEAANKRHFRERWRRLTAETAEASLRETLRQAESFLGALLDLPWPDSPYTRLDPKGRFENVITGLKAFFQAESRRRPTVLFLEDAHWLDDDSRHFLSRLTRRMDGYPLAIIITGRPNQMDKAPLPSHLPRQTLSLDRIGGDDVRALASGLLEGPVSDELARLLRHRAEGNPFFAEQILLYLREQDQLEQASDGWRVRPTASAPLPTDIRAVLVARLDRLTQGVKEVVQTAAVLGREFEVRVLAQMLRDPDTVRERVKQAEEGAIWVQMNRWRYLFSHILLRDAAYTMQLQARRRQLHRLAAEALRILYGDEPTAYAADLAYHYDRAQMPYQAVQWYRHAGEGAMAQYATQEALDYLSRALQLISSDDLHGRYALLLAREEVYDWRGQREAQKADLATLQELATQLGPEEETAVLLRRANYASVTGDYPAAAHLAQTAVRHADAHHLLHQQAQAHRYLGSALWRQNRHEQALPHFKSALKLARGQEDLHLVTESLNGLGMVLDEQSDYEAARSHYEEALQIQRQNGDLLGQNKTLNNLGWIFFMQGDTVTAQRYYQEALQVARRTGNRIGESSALTNVGVIAFKHGDADTAQTYYETCLALCEEIGNVGGEANMHANLALLYHRRGEEETAVSHARCAIEMAQEISYHPTQAEASVYLGHALLAQGELAAAATAYRRANRLNREGNRLNRVMEGRAGLARVALAAGDLESALAEVEAILTQMASSGVDGVLEISLVYLTCYRVLAAASDPRAPEILAAAHQELQSRAARIQDAGARRLFLQNIPAHRALMALR